MKNFFIAYRHSGEDILELEKRIRAVEVALAAKKIKAYATLFDEETFKKNHTTAAQIMEKAFQKIAAMDGLFVLITGNEKSEGQLMEVGYAIAIKKPIIVAFHQDAKTYVPELATHAVAYSDFGDLEKKILELNI